MQIRTRALALPAMSLALMAGSAMGQSSVEDADRAMIDEIIAAAGSYVAPAGDCPQQVPGEPSAIGAWDEKPFGTNVGVAHAALLLSGKVIWYSGELGGPLISGIWDPETDQLTTQSLLNTDIFCGHHAFLADGTYLSVGGGGLGAPGITNAMTFDHVTETWSQKAKMQFGRWYPTAVTLPDGKVAVFSGEFGPVQQVEVYDPETDDWETLPSSANKHLEIYPSFHLMPDGRLFYSGTRWNGGAGWGGATTALLDLETNTWSNVGNHVVGDRAEGMSVLLPEKEAGAEPWRVLVAGGYGSGNKQDTAEIIDLSLDSPSWQAIDDMNYPRNNANGVILPDGNVLFCTGIEGFKWNFDRIDTHEAELFDPATNEWSVMAPMSAPGQYHSVSILLPDGRVLKTGGQDGGPIVYDVEIYSPPYLFWGQRPSITSAPSNATPGQTISIDTPEASDIQMVSLVRFGSITHHTNADQRFLSLEFTQQDANTLKATLPSNGAAVPPGPYMLHVVDDCGVPSHSEFVVVGVAGACYADFNGDGALNILDFVDYQNAFTAGDLGADCDGDGSLTILDFICFQNAFTAGCA